ncbi:nucleotide-binding domain-containing protein [Lophiostoma macrostomum CBS 122681]|uniref:Nucleotide-binding domain-containing protein n=1 Tax=Lophiostoma macrostomum CBS 122681 TaxID=1314788 RepID=A0A6A6TID0_9PLEO|nr:nucleotide-binding domain-containing protein [Lophiostoma macrostomum CBS 122681]
MSSERRLVAVIGAGVIGLQTSISLRQAGFEVVLLAKHFPGEQSIEYTSPWAGAHWRSHAGEDDLEQQQWDTETYKHMLSIIEKETNEPGESVLSGLALRHSRYFSTSASAPWWSNLVRDYQTTPSSSLAPGTQHGTTYTSIMINAPMYLSYLLQTAQSLGVQTIRAALPSNSDLSESLHIARKIISEHHNGGISAFVNATGICARTFVPDPAINPVRGHTVTVIGEAKQITTIEAPSSADPSSNSSESTPIMYILPRPHCNTTILGGTKDVDNWDPSPSPATTAEILRRAKEWAPELLNSDGEFSVLSEQIGLRPARKGGVRVEIEKVEEFVVCHSYGHAGAGYQNSVGSAEKVVRLLDEELSRYT